MKIWVSALFPSTLYVALNLESTLGRRSLKGGQEVPAICFDCSDSAVEPEFGLSVEIQIEVFMGYEVDFLAVGDNSKSGDAIAIRFWSAASGQYVVVIDGGNSDSGDHVVQHVLQYYGTDEVDLLINTHPHSDHTAGLGEVLTRLRVKTFAVHQPWLHSGWLHTALDDGRQSVKSISRRLRDELYRVGDLIRLARKRGTAIVEPFSDGVSLAVPGLTVLGPSEDYYRELLVEFDAAVPRQASIAATSGNAAIAKAMIERYLRSHGVYQEKLEEPEEDTTAENNSSVITLLQWDARQLLFTGDAGIPALSKAIYAAFLRGIDLKQCCFYQVPHHGSDRNVSPDLLNELLGAIDWSDSPWRQAFVSAAKHGEPDHPDSRVTCAFRRRGVRVYATQGMSLCHSHLAPSRPGWGPAPECPFTEGV